ncbi:MAG: tRNA (N(6)-L-threonylcarbamoyladenosine(37)-C(2))-methylthiotransferase MtaB [Clostridia bacterium]|nr:tRNA (N(6)-L-threonylcarbamoyladenosine(37)-C(2))-methylthiotransferase MtaB [Clostridia bacterium]
MKIAMITLGCRVNQYESDAMAELLTNAGHSMTPDPSEADVCIVNTCTVTNIADRKSRQMLSKAHRLNPNARLVAAGCWSQRSPEQAANIEGVDAVLGSADRSKIVEIVEGLFKAPADDRTDTIGESSHPIDSRIHTRDIMRETEFEELSASREGRTRAYLKIQDGCNKFCTYCVIPYARGRLRSRSLASVRAEAEKLDAEGFVEVVLTGIHLMSYGVDFKDGTNIADAVNCFAGLDNIRRIRFGSLEPHLMTDELIAALAKEKRICRQFHLSLQSGSDTVLERMNRGYTSAQYLHICDSLRAAFGEDTAITTDIIAGFPGESDQEHLETIAFMRSVPLARTHIFPYSRRSGTKAAAMRGQLSNAEKSRRAGELIAVSRELEREYVSRYVGRVETVLVEENKNGLSFGCTDTYVKTIIDTELPPNTLVRVQIDSVKEENDGELSLLSHRIG